MCFFPSEEKKKTILENCHFQIWELQAFFFKSQCLIFNIGSMVFQFVETESSCSGTEHIAVIRSVRNKVGTMSYEVASAGNH